MIKWVLVLQDYLRELTISRDIYYDLASIDFEQIQIYYVCTCLFFPTFPRPLKVRWFVLTDRAINYVYNMPPKSFDWFEDVFTHVYSTQLYCHSFEIIFHLEISLFIEISGNLQL